MDGIILMVRISTLSPSEPHLEVFPFTTLDLPKSSAKQVLSLPRFPVIKGTMLCWTLQVMMYPNPILNQRLLYSYYYQQGRVSLNPAGSMLRRGLQPSSTLWSSYDISTVRAHGVSFGFISFTVATPAETGYCQRGKTLQHFKQIPIESLATCLVFSGEPNLFT